MITSLTDYEMNLVTDSEMLLTKNKIIQKVYELLGCLSDEYKTILHSNTNMIVLSEKEAKIARGENYKGLPYVIMDYPRLFSKADVFAIRTFFWWGNFFSITLQLSGKYQDAYFSSIEKAVAKKLFQGWFVGCAPNPWEHHFEKENYLPIVPGENMLSSNLSYLKISKKIPLEKWDEVEIFMKENFSLLIKVLTT